MQGVIKAYDPGTGVGSIISDAADPLPPPVPGMRIVRAATLMTGVAEREGLAREVLRQAAAAS